jgi:diguanylate cyclase (GGDEF)-like protein/PAS domain S-box-containing protein
MSRAKRAGEVARGLLRLEAPVLLAVWLLLRHFDYVAGIPVWVFALILVGAMLTNLAADQLFDAGKSERLLWARVAASTVGIGLVMYATGWGPMLAIGFAFMLSDNTDYDNSSAAKPVFVCAAITTFLGGLAIQLHWAPSFVHPPVVHGIAVLELLGLGIVLRGWYRTGREKQSVEFNLRTSENRFRALVANAADVIVVFDVYGNTSYVSPAFEKSLGYGAREVFHLDADLVHPDDIDVSHDAFVEALEMPGRTYWMELRLRTVTGDWHWFEIGLINLIDDPNVSGLIANMRDITERRLFEQQLEYQAKTDALTQLPNRRAFLERLDVSLLDAAPTDRAVAVLFLDIDRFKLVNDSLGHDVGDRLLIEVARRLRETLRPSDLVARFGGDEFTILVEDIRTAQDAIAVAGRIDEAIRQPIVVGSHELIVTASVGIAVAKDGFSDSHDLLREADLAMYTAKDRGRSRFEVYDETQTAPIVERLELETELWRAIDDDQLVVHYQPDVALVDGHVIGVEALVRWQHPVRGLLAPGAFIPIAEESSLILAIDRFVLREACHRVSEWEFMSAASPEFRISVNLSPRFVRQDEAVADILSILTETGADPRRLQLEITERNALFDDDRTVETLGEIRALGMHVAIDDFGIGYSSLGYLMQFPIDVLKLDKSFIDTMHGAAGDAAIAEAVITMGHALGMRVTAEGVENAAQASTLRRLGCDSAQGFHFSKPLAAHDVVELFDQHAVIDGGTVVPFVRRIFDAG